MAKFFLLNWNVIWLLSYISINGYCINIINLLNGESRNISCTTEDVFIDSFEWTFNNSTSCFDHNYFICNEDENDEVPCNSSFSILNILNVQQSDEGDYYCFGNLVDNTTTKIAAYRVIVHQLSAPVITTNISSTIRVKPRSNISLEVFITNVQWNQTHWRYNNNSILDFKPQFNITNQNVSGILSTTLHLYNLIQNNSGNYSVHASNSLASVSTFFSITIAAAAAIIHPNSNSTFVSIHLNDPFSITCTARGVPQPVITWDSEFPSAESNTSYNSTEGYYYTSSQLRFPKAQKNSTLIFKCSASNGQSDQAIYYLTITYSANITSRSDNLTIYFHRIVNFTCVAEGSPIPTIIWRNSTGVIGKNYRHDNMNNSHINSTLTVDTSLIKNSSYLFFCLASNSIGNSTTTFSITIQTLVDIINLPRSTKVTAPNGTSITCIASGYPTSNITWRFSNNTEIKSSSMYNIMTLNLSNSIEYTLQIFNISLSDNGTFYWCETTLMFPNQTSISIAAHSVLIVYVIPNITSYLPEGSSRYVVNVSDDITFQCTATGVPPPDIQWYRGTDQLNSNIDERITIHNALTNESNRTIATVTRNITLTQTNVSDSGNYHCEARNAAVGGMDSEEFELFVEVPAIITEAPVSQTITLPALANFSCTASGAPIPHIMWIGPNKDVILSDKPGVNITHQIIQPNTTRSVLSFSEVNLSSNGTYVCRAGNTITKVNVTTSESADLIVYVVPNITLYLPEGSSRYVVNVTDDITFQCTATGVPPPDIQWYRENVTLNSSNDRSVIQNIVEHKRLAMTSSNLTIINSTVSDGGIYSCKATNSAQGGADDETFTLLVQSPPNIFSLNQTVQFNETAKICFQVEPFDNYSIMWYYTSNTSLETSIKDFNYFQNITSPNSTTSCSTVYNTSQESCHYCLTITKSIAISESLQESNQGIYVIKATNAAGLSTTNYSNVLISDFPHILVTPTMITVAIKTTVTVSFTCFAILHNDLLWEYTKLNGQTYAIEDGSKYHIQTYSNKQTLIISEVSIADKGNYTCIATNDVGESMATVFLIVNDSYFTTTVPTRITKKTVSIVHTNNIPATSSNLIVIVPSVAGMVIVFACVFLMLIAGICFITKNQNKTKASVNGLDGIEVELIRKDSEVPLCYFPPEQGSEYREPIPLELLSTHLDTMHWNENCGFVEEYKVIQEKSPDKLATVCLLPENSCRNRYKNIKCFDETRVELTPDESSSNDYINANFIKGYNRPKEYIACQGPLDDTIADFWKMVYDYDVPTIVMLTNLVEKMKMKCSQYWPQSDSETYSKYEVTVVNTTTLADFVIRDIKITNKDDGKVKEVKQLHFISWPDFGVPRNPTPLLHFLQRVRTFHPYSDNRPMVFHCSAGVGRTGTLITIDVQLQRADKEKIIDPFNFVRELREQRNFMVQAEAQYIFLHDAILEGSVSGNTEVPVEELNKKMEYLKEGNEEMDNGYKKEFELLKQFKIDVRELSVANEDKNAFKNRVTNALPYNHNRVILQMKPGCSGSDYINASFVDGYSKKAAYIATQGPLPNTVEDFWRMVWEKSVNVIVMLTQLVEKDKEMCCCYWPEKIGSTTTIGDFIVELLSEDQYDDYYTREMKILEQESGKSCMLRQFHFTSWPEHGAPESGAGMVDLIDQVTRRQRQTGDNHIVVHCSAGVGRTGAFICLSIAIERVQSEGTVDIFHTIKHLRTQRPHLIQNVDQYIFCYNAIRDYVESLDNYSNLK